MGDGFVVMGMDIMGGDVGCGWGLRGGGSCRDEGMVSHEGVGCGVVRETPTELTRGHVIIRRVRRT